MNRKQFLFTLLAAVISAFLGGTFGVWFLMPPSVLAQDEPQKVIEAQEFRVVDEEGRMRAKFGFGTFQDKGYIPETRLRIFDEEGKERISLVDTPFSPYLLIQKDENGPVVQVSIEADGRPEIEMWHAGSDRRVLLGLSAQGNPSLRFFDEDANTRAVLGTTELKHPDTGSIEIRAPSSLVLFNKEGNVVWKAP